MRTEISTDSDEYPDREKEEEHLNRLLLLRLTNPWSSVPVRDAIERIGSGKGTFNTPQVHNSYCFDSVTNFEG